jgi:hypothetical protein
MIIVSHHELDLVMMMMMMMMMMMNMMARAKEARWTHALCVFFFGVWCVW